MGMAESETKPLFLTKDDTISNGIVILKYISDDNTENINDNITKDSDACFSIGQFTCNFMKYLIKRKSLFLYFQLSKFP